MKNQKVLVNVEPTYLEEHSDPYEDSYLWAYKVKIKNNSDETIKLISRHWKIFDSNGSFREVRGKGVVGEQPILEPGEEFEYTSGTPQLGRVRASSWSPCQLRGLLWLNRAA